MSKDRRPSDTLVAVGMSGGVDSSVTALLLKEQGFKVVGLFMKNWDEAGPDGRCMAAEDFADVEHTCAVIGIPCQAVDFTAEYKTHVFSAFLEDYKAGFTPNPDILCNRHIKFNVFFEKARALGSDLLATGHYAELRDGRLFRGRDKHKDQSYFLHGVEASVFERVVFPIGHLEKSQVRDIALRAGLPTASKKDSTGICFIGERPFREFLSGYIGTQPGTFKTLDGSVAGRHLGTSLYTTGQRRQLGLGGRGPRWYVVDKNPEERIVYVERGRDHPHLYRRRARLANLNWIRKPAATAPLHGQTRYHHPGAPCGFDGEWVEFLQPEWAMAPGQWIAFYEGEECLGGGRIVDLGPSEWELNAGIGPHQEARRFKRLGACGGRFRRMHFRMKILVGNRTPCTLLIVAQTIGHMGQGEGEANLTTLPVPG